MPKSAAEHIRSRIAALAAALLCACILVSCAPATQLPATGSAPSSGAVAASVAVDDLSQVPDYSSQDYIELNGGVPSFTEAEMSVPDGFEEYGALDHLGRATYAFAKLCGNTAPKPGSTRDTNMPDPSGWLQAYYPDAGIDHLYERSHLIAYSLNDEAVNPCDLITGTQHLNQSTMRDFETALRNWIAVADEALGHENHVLMRVTPDFRGNELVARGIQIEALSLEDGGDSISLNVYCYNIQPGVVIDYATGESRLEAADEANVAEEEPQVYVLNTSTKRFHAPGCGSAVDTKPENRDQVEATRSSLIEQGYQPCGRCKP